MTCSTNFKKYALLFVAIALFVTGWMTGIVSPTRALAQATSFRNSLEPVPSQGVRSAQPTQKPLFGSSNTKKPATVEESERKRIANAYGKLAVTFEANQGQFDPQVKFLAHGAGYNVFLTATEAVLVMKSSKPVKKSKSTGKSDELTTQRRLSAQGRKTLRMKFLGANAQSQITGIDKIGGTSNYLIGNDSKKWQTNVSNYSKVKYASVYRGVDVVYYDNNHQLEYDLIVSPGTDPRIIKLGFEGAKKLQINSQGDLVLSIDGGEIRGHKPVAYQEVAGSRRLVASRYRALGRQQVGFELGPYDVTKPLFIDPILSYSTYLGGYGADQAGGIALDGAGNAYITGRTTSPNFPTTLRPASGGADIFITKLKPEGGGFIYTTYLGGSGDDDGSGIAVDAYGKAYVTGATLSNDFPTQNALQSTYGGSGFTDGDAFVVKLSQKGDTLDYCTYLGGTGDDRGGDIAVDGSGNAYIGGYTGSTNFPTLNPFQAVLTGPTDAFVTKLNPTGASIVYSTFLGGAGEDRGYAIAVNGSGNAYLTGRTESNNFPTSNPFQSTFGGASDGFVTKLNVSGNALTYSTYLGGNDYDYGGGIAVDSTGSVFISGTTMSTNFPVQTPYKATMEGGSDAFITKLTPAGNLLVFSTYLGGSGYDSAGGIAIDASGCSYVTGSTPSNNFPTLNPVQSVLRGDYDAFVTKLNPTGTALVFSTYFGGSAVWVGEHGNDFGSDLAVDAFSNIYIAGTTDSSTFTVKNAVQPTFRFGQYDAFVMRIDDSSTAFTLSGSVNDPYGNGVNGVTLDLSGTQQATIVTDVGGYFSFGNLSAGDYTITPSKTDYTFVPEAAVFTGLNADRSAILTAISPYNISGHLSDAGGANLEGATVILSGSSIGTVYSDANGNYSLNVAPGGNYVVTPQLFTYAFTPGSQTFNDVTASQTADFIGTLASFGISGHVMTGSGGALVDITVTLGGAQNESVQTDAGGNYAFASVPAGGNYTVTPSSLGFTFSPRIQPYANLSANQTANFTGIAYTISGQILLNTGGPVAGVLVQIFDGQTGATTTDANGNYSFTVAPGLNYYVYTSDQNYQIAPDSWSFSSLTANQIANFTATRLYTISGQITSNNQGIYDGVSINYTGSATGSAYPTYDGTYSFKVPAGGNYTVTAKQNGYGFTPVNQVFNNLSSDGTANFAATSIILSGRVTNSSGAGLSGATITLGGSSQATFQTNSSGNFSFTVTPGGNYSVTPSKTDYTFNPVNQIFNAMTAPQNASFGTFAHNLTGQITDSVGVGISGVTLNLTGLSQPRTAQTNSTGNYTFSSLPAGFTYLLLPSKTNYLFLPGSQSFNLTSDQSANFTGSLLYTISGRVATNSGTGISAATVSLSGAQTGIAQTDANGNYSFPSLAPLSAYWLSVSKTGYSFAPLNQVFSSLSGNQTANFVSGSAGTVLLNPTGDAHVKDGTSASTNFGTATLLEVRNSGATNDGNNRDAYFKFDVSTVSNVGIVKLRIYASLSATGTVATTAYPVAVTTWIESGTGSLTWSNKPPLGTAIGSVSVTGTTYAWYEIDISSYVKSELAAGRTVVSLALHDAASSTPNLRINSREATTNKPELLITAETVTNTAPVVNAGLDQVLTLPNSATLDATVSDDGLPSPPASLTFTWSKVSGPGTATFTNPNAVDTTASFSLAGTYVLQLQATDSLLAATDQIQVIVNADPTVLSLAPTADSYVRDATANANTNFGTATTLSVRTDTVANSGNNRDAYFKFDTTSAGTSANVASAKLRIFAALSAAGTVSTSIYSVATTSWIESGTGSITWNNKPARGATALASFSVAGTTSAWYELDVTNFVKSEKTAGRNVVSFAIHDAAAATPIINFSSKESTTNKPVLVVTQPPSTVPKIIVMTPSFGLAGTVVSVIGLNFGAAPGSIKFNGVTANATNWSTNGMSVTVPAGATTGPVVVTVGVVNSAGVIFTVAAADSDTDADGLMDSWERMHFGGLTQTAAGDFDGDGLTNLQEYQQGRNPTRSTILDGLLIVDLKLFTWLELLH